MNASVLSRRRIERYAQLLDEADGARRHHAKSPIDDELATMVALGQDLAAATPNVAPRDEFRRDTRAMLMAVAERDGIGVTAKADAPEIHLTAPAVGRAAVGTVHESASRRRGLLPKQRSAASGGRTSTNRGRAKVAVLVGLAVGTLAVSGISAASGDAMPGDALYGVKRAAENTQISITGTDTKKGALYLQDAQRRLNEAQQISPDGQLVIDTLNTMDAQTTDGVKLLFAYALSHKDSSALATVDNFVTAQNKAVTAWAGSPSLPATLRNKLAESGALLDRIGVRSGEVRSAVNCASTPVTVLTDDLGKEPACHASASGTPAAAPVPSDPGKSSSGTPAGKDQTAPAGKDQTAPTAIEPTGAATPEPTQSYDGGVLGAVERLLGGL